MCSLKMPLRRSEKRKMLPASPDAVKTGNENDRNFAACVDAALSPRARTEMEAHSAAPVGAPAARAASAFRFAGKKPMPARARQGNPLAVQPATQTTQRCLRGQPPHIFLGGQAFGRGGVVLQTTKTHAKTRRKTLSKKLTLGAKQKKKNCKKTKTIERK